jgi:hypothetical protein
LAKTNIDIIRAMLAQYNTGSYKINYSLEFKSSLKVEVRRDGDTNAIRCWASYGILSEEFKREVIPAGKELPNRNYTYPFDVMVVWFRGSHGVSNKVQFPSGYKIDLSFQGDGTPVGDLKKAVFNTTVKSPYRENWVGSNDSVTVPVEYDNKFYLAEANSGKLVSTGLPKKTNTINKVGV